MNETRLKIADHLEIWHEIKTLCGYAVTWMVYEQVERKVQEEMLQLQQHVIKDMLFA